MNKITALLLAVVFFAACKKETEQINMPTIANYAPLVVGKYITYSLDSLVYINLGSLEAHHYYEVKYENAEAFTDLMGRKAFRIVRYIRTLPNGTFTPDNTFVAVNTGNTFEFTENNLRFLKLTLPMQNARSWKGNSAINTISDPTTNVDLSYLADWDYTYDSLGLAKKVGNFNLPTTVTVNQINESVNLPVIPPGNPGATNIASRDYSQEVYALGIGLVKRDFLHFEYQIAYPGYKGYGIKLFMIDHN